QRWKLPSREVAYYKLRDMLKMSDIRNTELIQISVLSTSPKEAAEIANRIAEEYQKKRIEEQQTWISRSLAQLRDEVEKQREKVEGLREKAAQLRVESGINDLNPEGTEEPLQPEGQVLMSVEQQVSTARL